MPKKTRTLIRGTRRSPRQPLVTIDPESLQPQFPTIPEESDQNDSEEEDVEENEQEHLGNSNPQFQVPKDELMAEFGGP